MKKNIAQLEHYLENYDRYLEMKAAELLSEPIPVLLKEKFDLYQLTGNRRIYELDYFAKRKFLVIYGLAAIKLVKEERSHLGAVPAQDIFRKLEEAMLSLCADEYWALPAHVTPRSVPPEADPRIWIDLFAAETAETLAHILNEAGSALSEKCRQTVRGEVFRRVLDPYFHSRPGYYYWERQNENWNAVCNGGVGRAYLRMLQPGEAWNREYMARICDNLLYYISGFAEDGTCMEGMGYYTYGMSYFVAFAQDLCRISGGEADLLRGDWGPYKAGELDKRARIAGWWTNCFFRSGKTVNFSDFCDKYYRLGLACQLALTYPNAKILDTAFAMPTPEQDENWRFVQAYQDYYAAKAYLERLKESAGDGEENQQGEFIILNAAQWCIGKAKNGVGLACKAGHNGEAHNHNDVSSFQYVVGGEMLLDDLGAGEYTKDYFTLGENTKIFCISSLGHNVPIIGGHLQQWGREFASTEYQAGFADGVGTMSCRAEGAYGPGVIDLFHRKLCFQVDTGALEVTDTLENAAETVTVTENLATHFEPRITQAGIRLMGKTGGCDFQILEDGRPVDPGRFRVTPHTHMNHQAEPEIVNLIQWDIPVREKRTVTLRIDPILLEDEP